jgi:tetratricopeptide (TPR) repeat protein
VDVANDDPQVLERLGVELARARRYEEAETSLRRSLALNAGCASAHTHLGNLLVAMGRPQEACEAFSAALSLDPTLALARFGLAVALIDEDRRDEAERLLRQLANDEPEFARARHLVDLPRPGTEDAAQENPGLVDARYHADRIRLVCATRVAEKEFMAETALGRSLLPWRHDRRLQVELFERNRRPLGEVYNDAIERSRGERVHLVFVHDDVHLTDFDWPEKMIAGLRQWHVLGLAGNRRRLQGQPAWCFLDTNWTFDYRVHLSGVVGHGLDGRLIISRYGPPAQRCVLLDGLLLAANSALLQDNGLRFDPQFAFHFYDLDFCRQAQARGLAMGTWPIQVLHDSAGAFGSEAWRAGYARYLSKYGESAA